MSGPVLVAKDESKYWKLKEVRDRKAWDKEYVWLVHGTVPPDRWQGLLENWMVTQTSATNKSVARSTVVDAWQPRAEKVVSLYQVNDYYERKRSGGPTSIHS